LTTQLKFDNILYVMAHYSSHYIHYEDGIKQPLNSKSVKLLVLASYAQFGVSAENESVWAPAMACASDPPFVETYLCV